MGITVAWDNEEKNTILVCYEQPWTLADFEDSQKQIQQLVSAVTHPVHTIMDVSKGGTPPQQALNRFVSAMKNVRPKEGMTVFVGANMLAQSIVGIVQKLSRASDAVVRFVPTREEARKFLSQPSKIPSDM